MAVVRIILLALLAVLFAGVAFLPAALLALPVAFVFGQAAYNVAAVALALIGGAWLASTLRNDF